MRLNDRNNEAHGSPPCSDCRWPAMRAIWPSRSPQAPCDRINRRRWRATQSPELVTRFELQAKPTAANCGHRCYCRHIHHWGRQMKLVVAGVALVWAAVVIAPASALNGPRSHGRASMFETVQQTPKAKPSSDRKERERCFVRCWHSCWGPQCVERCHCECSDGKSEYCSQIPWGLRPKGK